MAIDQEQLKDLMTPSMQGVGNANVPSRSRREIKKNYAVMLRPSFRKQADDFAVQLDLSFSQLVQKALNEYIENHK